MTREESLDWLCRLRDDVRYVIMPRYKDKFVESLMYAISALEQQPCNDAISREEVIKAIDTWDKFGCDADTKLVRYQDHYVPYIHYDDVIKCIKGMPSVTQKSGTWIAQDIHNCHTDFKCSECGYIHSFMHLYGKPTADYTYCPNCGARMESEDKE